MNLVIKTGIALLSIMMSCFLAGAQPRVGSVLMSFFETQPNVMQIATVISANGTSFTCRFSQTNSEYTFKEGSTDGVAKVVSSKGGKYSKGTTFFYIEYFILDDAYGCLETKNVYEEVIVKFPDGKAFLGNLTGMNSADGNMEVLFWHSTNKYVFNKDGEVISKTGGIYATGTIAKIFCASFVYPTPAGLKLPPLMEQQLNRKKQ